MLKRIIIQRKNLNFKNFALNIKQRGNYFKRNNLIELPENLKNDSKFNNNHEFPNPIYELVVKGKEKLVGSWLLLTAGSVFFMIGLGGYTRLTKSGLSMTEWKPLSVKYPSNDEEWNQEFEAYKNYPEFKRNKGMNIEEFKFIYFYEYFHRLVGRQIGMIFILPFCYFQYKGYLKPKMTKRCIGLLGLGAAQGAIGWWMVKSGLFESPDYQSRQRVSTYRLFVHLNNAIIIYSLLLWNALTLLRQNQEKLIKPEHFKGQKRMRGLMIGLVHLMAFNIISGVQVAGIDAGKVYNTWPLMNGNIFPYNQYINDKIEFWRNFFENRACVQFNHRTFAYITYAMTLYTFLQSRNLALIPQTQRGAMLVLLLVNFQVLWGIHTLLSLTPVNHASLHQCGALTVLSSAIFTLHSCRNPSKLYYSYLSKFA